MLTPSVLWKIKTAKNAPSYLFGTMHVRDNNAFSHVEKALKALDNCTTLKTELDIEQAQNEIMPKDYMMANGATINAMLRESRFLKMRHIILKSFGIDLEHWNRFHPSMIVNQIAESILNEDHSLGMDQFLWRKAGERGMLLGGIETVSNQIATLHRLDIHIQLKMLSDLTRNVASFRKSILSIIKLYDQQDISRIYKVSKKSMGPFREIMIYTRNKKMTQHIHDNIKEPTLYAVGAAHLGGNKGILALLKRKGYKIHPV